MKSSDKQWEVVGDRDDWNKAERLAKLSRERHDLVAQVPESVWLREDRSGESFVSLYLRAGGAATAVPEPARSIDE